MGLQEKLAEDLKDAMRKGDARRLTAIRLVRAGIKNTEVARGKPLDDQGVWEVIAKEAREHRDSISEFKKANRQDLLDKEEAELSVLLEYLPQQMPKEEIEVAARQVISQVGAKGPGDKGKVMPILIAQLKGRADGREINAVVTELLGQGTSG